VKFSAKQASCSLIDDALVDFIAPPFWFAVTGSLISRLFAATFLKFGTTSTWARLIRPSLGAGDLGHVRTRHSQKINLGDGGHTEG
jgi:predicted membrane protein